MVVELPGSRQCFGGSVDRRLYGELGHDFVELGLVREVVESSGLEVDFEGG